MIFNYKELNTIDYALHTARRCAATLKNNPRSAWLMYLQVIDDLLEQEL